MMGQIAKEHARQKSGNTPAPSFFHSAENAVIVFIIVVFVMCEVVLIHVSTMIHLDFSGVRDWM